MKKTFQYVLLIAIGCCASAWLHAQSTCSPVLGYNTAYNLCANNGVLDLTVSVGIPSGCAHANTVTPFNWQGPSAPGLLDDNNISITNPDAGNYSVQITLVQSSVPGSVPCPCIGSHTSNVVTVNEVPAMPNVTSDTIICGGSTILTAVPSLGSSGSGYFNWYDNANNLLFSGNSYTTNVLSSTTDYQVSYVENGCESSQRDFSAIVNPIPQPLLAYDTVNINCENSYTLDATSPSGGVVYWYSDIALTNLLHIGNQYTTPSLLSTTTYYAVSVNGSCHSASESVTIQTYQTPAPSVTPVSSCAGSDVVLTASHGGGALGSGLFEWYDNSNTLLHSGIQFTVPSSYTDMPGSFSFYVLENINGCRSTLSVQNVEILPLPDITLNETFQEICESASIPLSASSSFTADFVWQTPWGSEENGSEIIIDEAEKSMHEGSYWVYAQSLDGCKSEEQEVIVQVVASPNLGLLPSYEVMDGEPLQLWVSGADSFVWSPSTFLDNASIPNPVFMDTVGLAGNIEQSYQLTVVGVDADNLCQSTETTTITVVPYMTNGASELPIVIYDLFTPNGDMKNDKWYIDYLYNLTDYEIFVYNKSNSLVYYHHSNDGAYIPWDGTMFNSGSKVLPTGTYRYVIVAPNEFPVEPIKGLVTLLH